MSLCNSLCFNGDIVTPNYENYNEDRQIWNRAIQRYPYSILYCTDINDVIFVLKFALKNGYKFRIRGCGHNYEGYSIEDKALIIDLSRLNNIEVDYANNSVKIGAGVNNHALYNYLGQKGYPFPGGTCPTVGVIGYALGGGWGLSCRLFGLGADNLLEVELVNYKGELITANSKCNSDLFWALRGAGGGNFGIVTSATFRLPPKLNKVTLFKINYPNTSSIKQAKIMDIFQNLYLNLDRRVNMRCSFYNSKDEGLASSIIGLFYGTKSELKTILAPLLSIPNAISRLKYMDFLDAILEVEKIYPENEMFKSTGVFSNRLYSKDELLNLAESIKRRPLGSVFTAITFYGLGGAVSDIEKDQTAFYYRNSNYIIGIQSVWESPIYDEVNRAWIAYKLPYLESITNGFYINFPYYFLKDYEKEYYGNNICNLRIIKRKYDPFNIFKFQQSINTLHN